ncbi:MAG: MaoC family dehydratase [Thermoplasmatota archaeon]
MTPPPPAADREHLTGSGTYFEDFTVGDVLQHARGRTIPDSEHVVATCQALNTAQIHFNQDLTDHDPAMQAQTGGERLVVGTYVLSVCMGLASQDTTENAARILCIREAKHMAGVYPGQTLYAETEVLEKRAAPDDPGCGIVVFKLRGLKAEDRSKVAVEAVYEALVRRRPA